jgi:hypothetical protein
MSPIAVPGRSLYPVRLQAQVAHSLRFAELLDGLVVQMDPREKVSPWLVGRAGEVRVFVYEVVGDWSRALLDGARAAELIGVYVDDLHASFVAAVGRGYPPSCCSKASRLRVARRCSRLAQENQRT